MGYTNYSEATVAFTDKEWNLMVSSVDHLVALPSVQKLQLDWFIDDDCVGFNADGIETAVVYRYGTEWQFCKTNRRAPDKVVKALFTLHKKILNGTVKVSCDGPMSEYGNWHNATATRILKKLK